ncbi:hypothetical protein HDU98_005679 [Podochytrium sp. JEL0797]|nr:hypothetical protein HDU98_005679 [Podochytrium sp. JEL0797]
MSRTLRSPRRFLTTGRRTADTASFEHPWLVNASSKASGVALRNTASPFAPSSLGVFGLLKQRNVEQMGRHFASLHLAQYDFDKEFKSDAARAATAFFAAVDSLDDASNNPNEDSLALLHHVCVPSLANQFTEATEALNKKGLSVRIKLLQSSHRSTHNHNQSSALANTSTAVDLPKSPTSLALLASDPRFAHVPTLKSHITHWHWLFGPSPPPPTHILQHWLNFYSLVIPEQDSHRIEYHELKEIKQSAIDAGIVARVYVHFDARVEFSLVDQRTGIPVLRDVRDGFDLQFTSPMFTPWDDVLEPYVPADGKPLGEGSLWKQNQREEEWRLKWDWRVCDVDYLKFVPVGHSLNLWGGKRKAD